MSKDDFLLSAAEERLQTLQAARQRALADLAECQAMGDSRGAGVEIQMIANLDAEANNLTNLAQRHVASTQPPPVPRADAWREKRNEEMTYEDVRQMINATSQHKLSPEEYGKAYQEATRSGWAPGRGTANGR